MGKSISVLFFLAFTTIINAQNEISTDTISEKLEEIKIVKTLQTFINRNGNIKIDIENTALNSISNTLDLLAKIPTIQISSDKESIVVVGKGSPLLYIDKQKVTIEDLNNLDVDDIKTIEIIRNPSAKYESEGRSVLLITRKSSRKDGFKGSFTENASFKRYFNNYLGATTSFKKDKFEFKLNANYNQLTQWESNANDFSIPLQNIASDYLVTVKTPRPQFIFGGGVFYKINEDDYLSFSISNLFQHDRDRFISDSRYRQNTDYDEIVTRNNSNESRNFLNSFVNYNTKLQNGFQIFSGIQYSDFSNESESLIFNDINQSGAQLKQSRDQNFKINVASARIDVEKTFTKNVKIESGLLYLSALAKTNLAVSDYQTTSIDFDSYLQNEKNLAGYAQFSVGRKTWNYGAGLRLEKTIIDRQILGDGMLSSKNYINLFPKANLSYTIDSTRTVTLNYAKSISRPDYSSTNLNPTYINPYFVFSGNINLNPTITDELTLGMQQKENYFGITVYKSTNPAYYGFEYDDARNILTFKPVNFSKETGINLLITIPFKYKFWSTAATFSGIWNKVDDNSAVVNDVKPYLYVFSEHTFKLKREFTITLTGWGMTKRNEGVFDKNACFITNLAVMKSIGNDWVVTLSANDIFHQMNFTEKFTVAGIHSNVNYFTDIREFAFAIKYSFGKIKYSSYKEKEIDENANRIK